MTQLKQTVIVALLVSALLGTGTLLHADEPEGDLKEMQGAWKIEAAERGGEEFDIKQMGIDELKFDGDKMSLLNEGKPVAEYKIQLKSDVDPKKMAWFKPDKSWLPALYEFKEDKLRICFPMVPTSKDGQIESPKSFDTKDKPLVVITAAKPKS